VDINKLELFLSICDFGSLSKAAMVMQLPPSVISRQLAALEREWNGALFFRTGRGMAPTELGLRLLPSIKATVDAYHQLRMEVLEQDGMLRGEVRIGLVPSIAQAAAASIYREIKKAHPGITLQIMEGVSAQLDNWRMRGEVDFTVLFRSVRANLQGEDRLLEVETYLVGPGDDALTSSASVEFQALAGIPLVLAARPNALREDVETEARNQGIPLNVVVETSSLTVQCELAEQGDAYTIMTGQAAARRIGSRLHASRIVSPTIHRCIALGMRSDIPISAAVKFAASTTRDVVRQAY